MLRRIFRLFCLGLFAAFAAQGHQAFAQTVDITIEAKPIVGFSLDEPKRRDFGSLRFVGGLVLQSSHKHFGALSGLRVLNDGRIVSVTDTGFWLTAEPRRGEDGQILGFRSARMAPLLGRNAQGFENKLQSDAEAVAVSADALYISMEQNVRILKFPRGDGFLESAGQDFAQSVLSPTLSSSFGLEALAVLPSGHAMAGGLIAISEGHPRQPNRALAYLLHEGKAYRLSVRRWDGYYLTDAAFLPGGDLLLLERQFTPARGPQMRLRRIDLRSIRPDAVLAGTVIFEANRRYQIDNMEGLAVFPGPNGKTRIALVSDNNHFLLQRTLYLEFELRDP